MFHMIRRIAFGLAVAAVASAHVSAQAPVPVPPRPPAAPVAPTPPVPPIAPVPAPARPPVPMVEGVDRMAKCAVAITRTLDGKRVASLPYELLVPIRERTNDGTSLRVGSQVPIQSGATTSYTNVGVNIDCAVAQPAQGGVMTARLVVIDTSIGDQRPTPAIRTYSVTSVVSVREGQPLVFSLGTDPASGEVTRVEVTVTTLK